MKILLFIPTFNCSAQISRVLNSVQNFCVEFSVSVLLIDNQSSDGTVHAAIETVEKINKFKDLTIFRNDRNYGLGGSHKIAFQYGLDNGFDWVLALHGDDQAEIHDLKVYISEFDSLPKNCNYLGSRFMKKSKLIGYSRFRIIGNIAFNFLFSILARRKIYDLGSGLNLFSVRSMSKLPFYQLPNDLTFNYVLLLLMVENDQPLNFFPIRWSDIDQISNVKLFSHSFSVLRIFLMRCLGWNAFWRSEKTEMPPSFYSYKKVYSPLKKFDLV